MLGKWHCLVSSSVTQRDILTRQPEIGNRQDPFHRCMNKHNMQAYIDGFDLFEKHDH